MKLGDAMELLGLNMSALTELTPADAYRAFRAAVVRDHPDTGGEAEGAGQRIRDLQEARRVVTEHLEGRNNACGTCKGRGTVRAKFGATKCSSCNGTGEI